MKDLNIKPVTVNIIEENVGDNLELIAIEIDFLNRTPLTQSLRSPINKWNLQVDHSEIEASLVYNEFEESQGYREKLYL